MAVDYNELDPRRTPAHPRGLDYVQKWCPQCNLKPTVPSTFDVCPRCEYSLMPHPERPRRQRRELDIAQGLSEWMDVYGYSIAELQRRSGVTRQEIVSLKGGSQLATKNTAARLADALEVGVEDLTHEERD